jgi:4-hydroxy 2-oxovalerate aldolase
MVNKHNIELLDCTLRDGGYVNNFCFGKENIKNIVNRLSSSGVELIELGFLKNGNHNQDQTLFNQIEEAEFYTQFSNNKNQNYCLMVRPDWYDINKLTSMSGNINNIRFAFHYKDLDLTLRQANIARDLGYEVMLNPVNILSYTTDELETLLPVLNKFNPKCISIVDTFGSILPKDLKKIFHMFNQNMNNEIKLGLHLHENLSISLALAIIFIDMMQDVRSGYIDSSVLGIGRIPGNLCTELIMNYLNMNLSKNYDLSQVYELIDSPISSIKKDEPWGYMPAYAITAFNQIHRSYAEYLSKKPQITLNQIVKILDNLKTDEEKENFDQEKADMYYNKVISSNL